MSTKDRVIVSGTCKGIRTHCVTNQEREVDLQWEVREKSEETSLVGEHWLYLDGGPTGYESICLKGRYPLIAHEGSYKWCACAGTKGRWDELVILHHQMVIILNTYKEAL